MKVLLLYQYLNHTSTVKALVEHLAPEGIGIECLDIPNLNFISGRVGHSPFFRILYSLWIKYGKMRRLFSDYLRKKYIISQIQDFDIIDIHSYSLFYNSIIPSVKKKRKPLIIMLWGSDFYRASDEELEQKRLGFEAADIIHVESDCVKADFLKKFPEYEHKIFVVQFGLNQLDWIKNSLGSPLVPTLIERDIFDSKLIVTCGYNGSKGQQHLRMIEAIDQQDYSVKQRIHIVIPFTYGGDEEYKKQVITAMKKNSVTYTILDKRLSDEQLVELRRISHIAVNIQVTDSFSASILEHFMAGSVQIVGNWLPYDMFYNQGLYALKTSINDLGKNISEVVNKYGEFKERCANNSKFAYSFSSWTVIAPKWKTMYSKALAIK